MDRAASSSLAEQLAAASAWWKEAGVDCSFTEEPICWLREEESEQAGQADNQAATQAPPPSAPAPPPPPAIGGDPAQWPQDLAAFTQWWMADSSIDAGGARPRIAPRGPAGAKLMVLVPEPEAEDSDLLLSGPQGKLLASFFSAAGISGEETYIAAALPRHMPLPDWPGLAGAGLGAVTLHHIALAAPERLLVFGNDVLPLIGHNPAQSPASLSKINHHSADIPVLAARSLGAMLQRPALRSSFWQRWLDWTGN